MTTPRPTAPAPLSLCLWAGCSTPGPFQTDQALFEHLMAAHKRPARGAFECQWRGCSFTSANRYTDHIIRHTNYRPHGCTYPGCGKAFSRSFLLTQHVQFHDWTHVAEHACKWAACGAVFARPAELRTHIEDAHMATAVDGKRCGWAGCRHTFIGAHFHAHMTGHFPAFYQPLVCTRCEKGFKTEPGLKTHMQQVHGVEQDGRYAKAAKALAKASKELTATEPHADSDSDDPFAGLKRTGGGKQGTTPKRKPDGEVALRQRLSCGDAIKGVPKSASSSDRKRAGGGEQGGGASKRRKLSGGSPTRPRSVTASSSRAPGKDITNSSFSETRRPAPDALPSKGGIAQAPRQLQIDDVDDDDWVFRT